jgi:hypothetical protein
MSENENSSGSLVVLPPGDRTLKVSGGKILLPGQTMVEPGSPAFYELVKRAFPGDCLGQEVVESLQGQERRHSRAAKICLGVVSILVLALLYCCWPTVVKGVDSTDIVVIGTQTRLSVSPLHAKILKQVLAEYEQGRYAYCLEIMSPLMDGILQGRDEFQANARLVYLFLDCFLKNPSEQFSNQALSVAQKAWKLDPDGLEWALFLLNLEWRPFLDSYLDYHKMVSRTSEVRCLQKLTRLDKLATEIERANRNKPKDRQIDEATFKSLRLTRCQILTGLWLLHGQAENLPDNYGDPGVEYREKAYSLAKIYKDDLAFLNLRLFLAEKVMAGLLPVEHYRFGGEDFWLRSNLDATVKELQDRIAVVQEGRAHER